MKSELVCDSEKQGASVEKFETEENNEITISAQLNDQLVLNFQDNGKGISVEEEKKLFDPFFTTKRGQGGSGLGLHIVYNLVTQQLGGTLKVIQVTPHGLGFTITLNPSTIKVKHG